MKIGLCSDVGVFSYFITEFLNLEMLELDGVMFVTLILLKVCFRQDYITDIMKIWYAIDDRLINKVCSFVAMRLFVRLGGVSTGFIQDQKENRACSLIGYFL